MRITVKNIDSQVLIGSEVWQVIESADSYEFISGDNYIIIYRGCTIYGRDFRGVVVRRNVDCRYYKVSISELKSFGLERTLNELYYRK